MARLYNKLNVLLASKERIRRLFDMYERICVSVSGGKDSSVLFDLAIREAVERNRKIEVMFVDQEAEYEHTIKVIRHIASHPNVVMRWYQVPFLMTNSVSYEQDYLHCWDGGEIREREPDSIKDIGINNLTWEKLLPYLERLTDKPTAQLIGLRSSESLNRYRAVTKHPAIAGINWSSKTANPNLINFYPIYDYGFDDVWKYIHDHKVYYNRVYDFMHAKRYNKNEMRVSCLIHEKSYHCLGDLPEFEPQTYEWLCKRIKGAATGMRYSKEKQIYSNEKLPSHYKTWKEFRDFLLYNHPNKQQRGRFIKRFESMPTDETVFQQQVGQLLINDWEGITIVDTKREARKQEVKEKWKSIL